MTTELTTSRETQAFELVQRQAKLLASSTLVPKEFQGNMGNCAIALNIAKRMGADPFMVVQNVDIIHGRPSFRATFLIAMVNASGRFTPLQFRMTGDGQTRACVAHAKDKESGEIVEGPEVSMAMAKAEGWSTKAGSKWITMPELMLRYRAAAFFARLYAPDITLGMQTAEELHDTTIRDVTPSRAALPDSNPFEAPLGSADPEPVSIDAVSNRDSLIEDIEEAMVEFDDMSLTKLESALRKANHLSPTGTLKGMKPDRIEWVRDNLEKIIHEF